MKYTHEKNLFKNLPTDVQNLFLSKVVFAAGELPVYGLLHDEETWIFSTTRRLAWAGRGSIEMIGYADIKTISTPFWAAMYKEFLKEQDKVTPAEKAVRYQQNKMDLSKLVIEDKRGKELDLHWEPDDIDSIWEITTFSVRLDRIHKGDIRTKLSAFLRKLVTRLGF